MIGRWRRNRPNAYVPRHAAELVDGERGSAGDDQLVGVALGNPVRVTDYVNEIDDRPGNFENTKGI